MLKGCVKRRVVKFNTACKVRELFNHFIFSRYVFESAVLFLKMTNIIIKAG